MFLILGKSKATMPLVATKTWRQNWGVIAVANCAIISPMRRRCEQATWRESCLSIGLSGRRAWGVAAEQVVSARSRLPLAVQVPASAGPSVHHHNFAPVVTGR